MKLKENLEFGSDDFWYDVFEGGYIDPSDILTETEDIIKVEEAIEVMQAFKDACETVMEEY